MTGNFFIRQLHKASLGCILASNWSAWTKGFMLNFLIGKDKIWTAGRSKSTRQSNHIYHFLQDNIGSIDKGLFANFATWNLVVGLAAFANNVAFSTLDQSLTAKFVAHATGQKSDQIFILEKAIHADYITDQRPRNYILGMWAYASPFTSWTAPHWQWFEQLTSAHDVIGRHFLFFGALFFTNLYCTVNCTIF